MVSFSDWKKITVSLKSCSQPVKYPLKWKQEWGGGSRLCCMCVWVRERVSVCVCGGDLLVVGDIPLPSTLLPYSLDSRKWEMTMTARWRAAKSNRGFNLWATHGLLIMSWDKNVGTTSKTAFTVCRTGPITARSEGSPGPNPRQSHGVHPVMWRENHTHRQDTNDHKEQNALLEQQGHALEKAGSSAQWQTNQSSSNNSLDQHQGQHRVCLRWEPRLQLWVGARRAPEQEETLGGGQLSYAGQASDELSPPPSHPLPVHPENAENHLTDCWFSFSLFFEFYSYTEALRQ